MEKIFGYQNEEEIIVELVRYFRYNKTNYFIYTLNEKDAKGYIKLYIVKVMKSLGSLILVSVRDNKEWATMKEMVRTIIVDLKDKESDEFEDLDYNDLQGITLPNARSFKLDKKLLQKLLVKTEDEKFLSEIEGTMELIEDNKIIIEAINNLIKEEVKDNFKPIAHKTIEEKYSNVQKHLSEINKLLNSNIKKILN